MNSAILLLLLLFFPSGNNGYTSQMHFLFFGWGSCDSQCARAIKSDVEYADSGYYVCSEAKWGFLSCTCSGCARLCSLQEANIFVDACQQVQDDANVGKSLIVWLAESISDLVEIIANNEDRRRLAGDTTVWSNLGSAGWSTLKFGHGIYSIFKKQNLLDGVYTHTMNHVDNLNNCMGQKIEAAQVESQVDDMHVAFMLYDQARAHVGNDNDDRMDKLRKAWLEHWTIAHVKFDNVAKSAQYFVQLLTPLQDFAQSFVLISFDYLAYSHERDSQNYEGIFERTMGAFIALKDWADAAGKSIFNQKNSTMNGLPCRNGADIDAEMVEWSDVFESTYVSPIAAYIGKLAELNVQLVGVCPSLSTDASTRGRCGPLFGGKRCNQNLIGYAVYCNTDNGWCGTTNAHKNAQSDDIYDFNPVSCVKPEDIAQFSD